MTLFFAGETLSSENIEQSKKMKLDMKVREVMRCLSILLEYVLKIMKMVEHS